MTEPSKRCAYLGEGREAKMEASVEHKVPNARTRGAMAEVDAIMASGKARFRNPGELFAALDALSGSEKDGKPDR